MHPVIPYVTAALLFGIGVSGVLRRRNAVLVLMSVELMLNAVNLILVTADRTVRAGLAAAGAPPTGQVFALFVIVIAAAEVGVGLALVLQLYRLSRSVAVDEVPLDPSSTPGPTTGPTGPGGGSAPPGGPDGGPPPAAGPAPAPRDDDRTRTPVGA